MHSFNSCLMHCVFSTTECKPLLADAIREQLSPYLGGTGSLAHKTPMWSRTSQPTAPNILLKPWRA